ncbi:MAG TPA: AAA family ATPase [Thermoplasmata archaeon]|nr:AAA family ATPase [Thermoplasmata archaeon]
MNAPIVTLTGPPGSGKSTAGRKAAGRLHLAFVSAGEAFRAEASRRGMDLASFSRYAEEHPEVDKALDERMVGEATSERLLEGRITGALLRRRGMPVIYLVVTAREDVRVARLAGRDRLPLDATRQLTRAREASERDRYRRYYGIDLDREPADLVVDSSLLDPDAVAHRLVDFVTARREHRL